MRPRILHVLEAIEGGTARHARDLVVGMNAVDHVVAVPRVRSAGVTDHRAVDEMRAAGAQIVHVDMVRSATHWRNLIAVPRVAWIIRRQRIDIVHAHSAIGGAVGRLAAIGGGAAVVYTPNGIATAPLSVAIERLVGRLTDRFVAVSPSEAEVARRLGLVRDDDLSVIPNGVDGAAPVPLDPSLRSRLGVGDDTALVGTICRLIDQKSPELFVQICHDVGRRIPSARFVLIGTGPLEDSIQQLVHRLGLGERLHILPHLPEGRRALRELDVFVLHSAFEGAPYTPLEAMVAGTAVVLSDVVGNRDVVENGITGRLTPFGDVRRAGAAIHDLLTDPVGRQALEDRAAAMVRDRFGLEQMIERTEALYRELLRPPTPRI